MIFSNDATHRVNVIYTFSKLTDDWGGGGIRTLAKDFPKSATLFLPSA